MIIFGYKITRLGWLFLISILISLINPLLFGIVLAVWMFIAVMNFAKRIKNDN